MSLYSYAFLGIRNLGKKLDLYMNSICMQRDLFIVTVTLTLKPITCTGIHSAYTVYNIDNPFELNNPIIRYIEKGYLV